MSTCLGLLIVVDLAVILLLLRLARTTLRAQAESNRHRYVREELAEAEDRIAWMRAALACIADPPNSDWAQGEYPLVIGGMQDIARAALKARTDPLGGRT